MSTKTNGNTEAGALREEILRQRARMERERAAALAEPELPADATERRLRLSKDD